MGGETLKGRKYIRNAPGDSSTEWAHAAEHHSLFYFVILSFLRLFPLFAIFLRVASVGTTTNHRTLILGVISTTLK
jgi:hypothetical protein